MNAPHPLGLRANLPQVAHQLIQVLLVGMTLGSLRTVVPTLSESEFGVPKGSFLLLVSFVLAFGLVKALLNLAAGSLADHHGRRRVLILGWLIATPIPLLLATSSTWSGIVLATVLLGVQQGLTWSMTQTSKLDLTRPEERGLTLGLNEFAGYAGVALSGLLTAFLVAEMGTRQSLLWTSAAVIALGLGLALLGVRETRPWSKEQYASPTAPPPFWSLVQRVSWQDRRLFALCQAGLVEKFVDALVWVALPVYLVQQGLSLVDTGLVVGVYGVVWGASQLLTGRLSDRLGRHPLNVGGMALCGFGVALFVLGTGLSWWILSAALTGAGMAMLYPNLSAAVADLADPAWRGSAIGIYRFWRDLGYAVGALGLGLVLQSSGVLAHAFWFVSLSMFASALILLVLGVESRPSPSHRSTLQGHSA